MWAARDGASRCRPRYGLGSALEPAIPNVDPAAGLRHTLAAIH
jgi:hypothetical protein